jgi:hypothetical protein
MPREEYVDLCKLRALNYLDQGDIEKAAASIIVTLDARTDQAVQPNSSQPTALPARSRSRSSHTGKAAILLSAVVIPSRPS